MSGISEKDKISKSSYRFLSIATPATRHPPPPPPHYFLIDISLQKLTEPWFL